MEDASTTAAARSRSSMQFSAKWETWVGGAVAALGALALCLSYTPGWSAGQRAPTEHETVLYYFAENLGETVLCDRISWAAFQSYGALFGGGGSSRWRSDCYERVAQARHDPSICWNVRPLVDLDPLSTGYSALACGAAPKANTTAASGCRTTFSSAPSSRCTTTSIGCTSKGGFSPPSAQRCLSEPGARWRCPRVREATADTRRSGAARR